MTPKASRKKRNMGEVIADGWVEETVEAVDFAAPHDFGERQVGEFLIFAGIADEAGIELKGFRGEGPNVLNKVVGNSSPAQECQRNVSM